MEREHLYRTLKETSGSSAVAVGLPQFGFNGSTLYHGMQQLGVWRSDSNVKADVLGQRCKVRRVLHLSARTFEEHDEGARDLESCFVALNSPPLQPSHRLPICPSLAEPLRLA
jgi:hypothetical protein